MPSQKQGMKRENYRDSLEEVFSERFHQSPDADEAWSLPSEAAWDAIAEQLPPARKRRLAIWWLWIGVGLFAVLLLTLNLVDNDPHTEESVGMLDVQKSTEISTSSTSIASKYATDEVATLDVDTSTRDSRLDEPPTSTPARIVQVQQNQAPFVQNLPTVISEEEPIEINTSSMSTNTTSATVEDMKVSLPTSPTLSNNSLITLPHHQNYALPILFEQSDKQKSISSQRCMQVESVFAASWGTNPHRLDVNDIDLAVEAEKTISYGVQLERTLRPNWLVGTGLLMRKVQFDSDYNFDLAYQSDNEQLVAQGYASTYSHNLPSLASQFQTEVVLVRSSTNEVASDTAIPVELSLAHDITYLSIPAYLQYQQRKGRWTYYIKSGLSTDILLKDLSTEHLQTTSKHDAFEHHNSNVSEQNTINGRRLTLNYIGGLGVQRHLNSSLYLYAEPNVSVSLLSTYPRIAGRAKDVAIGGQIGFGVSF